MITISIPIESGLPTYTAQQRRWAVRAGRPVTYPDKRAKATKAALVALLLPHAPANPIAVPVRLDILLTYPYRTTDRQARKAGAEVIKSTRPDLDNSMKLLQDTMTACGYWTDDSLIADLHVRKVYGREPGLCMTIDTIEITERKETNERK